MRLIAGTPLIFHGQQKITSSVLLDAYQVICVPAENEVAGSSNSFSPLFS